MPAMGPHDVETLIDFDFPEEPPVGSIIIDRKEMAWQRGKSPGSPRPLEGGWQQVINDGLGARLSWGALLTCAKPVRLVYRGLG